MDNYDDEDVDEDEVEEGLELLFPNGIDYDSWNENGPYRDDD